jgi:hypothetical protein
MFGLVVAVMTSPIRPTTHSRADCLRRNVGMPRGKIGSHSVAATTRAGYRVKAVRTETEERDRSATSTPTFSCPIPLPHTAPARDLTPTITERSARPLRC